MARSARGPRRISSRQFRSSPYLLRPFCRGLLEKENHSKKPSKAVEKKKDWEDATCSVCMEFPHNAVLLLCSSHDKGCRPYMCGTSYRYSNCLDLYKKAYTKVLSPQGTVSAWPPPPPPGDRSEAAELSCPLCRGQVKGWTVVETAREYLNAKRRSCMQDNCSFVGSYRELRKHMRAAHPSAKPREVDPTLEQKWRRLEREREHEDVISVIRSSTPGAVVWGDYVIEGGSSGSSSSSSSSSDEEEGGDVAGRDRSRRGGIRGFDPSILYVLSLVRAFQNSRSAGHGSPRSRRAERGGVHRLPVSVNGGGGGFSWNDEDFIVNVDDDDDDDPVLRPVSSARSPRASVWDDDADGGGGVDGVAVVGGEGRGARRSERRRRRRHRRRSGAPLEGDGE